jgi:hypothetical protein
MENPVLWVRSDKIGSAENKYNGQLEHWNIGFMGSVE